MQSVLVNLAIATWSAAVNVSTLLAAGSFVDMFSLYRGALESFSYFWYMRRNPSEISEWEKALGLDEDEPLEGESKDGEDELKTDFEWAVNIAGPSMVFELR